MGQRNPKRANKKQWLKLFVLTFAVADAAGIYVANKRLHTPVPGSVQDEMVAYADRSAETLPRVVSVTEPGAQNVAVDTSRLTVNPDLRFAPDHAVPDFAEPKPAKLAKVELPVPAFGTDSHKPAAVALAAPAKAKAPVLLHTVAAPQSAAVSFDKPTARLTTYVPVQRQITALVPVHAGPASTHAVPSPKLARIAAQQTAALAPVHLGAATMHAVPSPRIARMATSSVQTTLHHSASHPVQHNSVQLQAPSFSAAFADIATNSAKADQSAEQASDWAPASSDFQHVAAAPAALDMPDAASVPVSDQASVPAAPAPPAELPAVSPAPDAAG